MRLYTLAVLILVWATLACGSGTRPGAPTNVVAEVVSPTAVEVRWQPLRGQTAHRVYFATDRTDLRREFISVGPDATSVRIDGLTPATTYFFLVRSFQPVLGESLASNIVSVTTNLGPLEAPSNLRATLVAPNSITLAWDNTDLTTDGFVLEQRLPPEEGFMPVQSLPPESRSTMVRGLVLSTRYQFRLQSFRDGTISPFSNTATVTTTRPPGVGITALYPPTGNVDGGFPVAIEGWGFTAAPPRVFFGDEPAANVLVIDDTHLSCLAPVGDAGSVDVSIENDDDTGTSTGTFSYVGEASPALTIDLQTPDVTFDSAIGVTTVRAAFVVRGLDGLPIRADGLTTRLFVDGEELGVSDRFNESLLDEQSRELEQNVFLFLTLDASFSLTQFEPEQFTPMLDQARNLVQTGLSIWGTAPDDPMLADDKFGVFLWDVAWFRQLIEVSTSTLTPDQLLAIPTPDAGNETKMNSAISFQIDESTRRFRAGRAAGPLDRHIVVVFTDGQDTLSWFNNPGVVQSGNLDDGTPTLQRGWRAVDVPDLFEEIIEHPLYPAQFSVFTVGLGDGVDQTPLQAIAQVGLGRFFFEESDIASLFDRLAAEITEQLTRGATLAIEPGDYQFRIVVERAETGDTAEAAFTFRGGDPSASVISIP